jgi:hypothetical protein
MSVSGVSPSISKSGATSICRAAVVLIGLLMSCLAASLAHAHHSALSYDFSQNVWISGTIKEVRVINPHMRLTLVVSDSTGPRELTFDGHGVNNFYRVGWRASMLKEGDKIKVRFSPYKDGREGGFVTGFVTALGQQVLFEIPGGLPTGSPATPPASGPN